MRGISNKGRRFFLKGLGSISIGLPVLEEFLFMSKAYGQTSADKKFVTMFVPNGMPADIIDRGLTGPLQSLAAFQDRITIIKNINGGSNGNGAAHFNQSIPFAVGHKARGNSAGGPSLDYYLWDNIRPQTSVDVLSASIGGNNPDLYRWIRTWRGKKGQTPTPLYPVDNAKKLFENVFGNNPNGGNTSTNNREARIASSVLDTVVEQYKAIQSTQSGYSAETKRKISNHLERIFEVEKKINSKNPVGTFEDMYNVMPANHFLCNKPSPYRDPQRGLYSDSFREAQKDAILYKEWCWAWPMICQVFGLALTSGYTHFGSLSNGYAGERYRNIGPEGNRDHHDYYHDYANANQRQGNVKNVVDWWLDQYYSRVSMALSIFDSIQEDNGQSLLSNMTLLIGPEMDYQHSCNNMSYMIAGGVDLFSRNANGKTIDARRATDVDFYNTIIEKFNIQDNQRFGNTNLFSNTIAGV